jgi:hypothetical protein
MSLEARAQVKFKRASDTHLKFEFSRSEISSKALPAQRIFKLTVAEVQAGIAERDGLCATIERSLYPRRF